MTLSLSMSETLGPPDRRGFALLGVLWIVVTLGVLTAVVGAAANRALGAAQAVRDREVGRWHAEGCFARAQSIVDGLLMYADQQVITRWRGADTVVLQEHASLLTGCDLTLEPDGRIVLARATVPQLDSLPGLTPEAVGRLTQAAALGRPFSSLESLAAVLSPESRRVLEAHFVHLTHAVTVEPDAWLVRSRAHLGIPPTPVNLEVRLVRAGTRVGIVRWVEW